MMNRISKVCGILSASLILWFAFGSLAGAGLEEKRVRTVSSPKVSWDRSMTPELALAQYTFWAFKNGDCENAAILAKVLDITWNLGEGRANDTALMGYNRKLYRQLDEAMDQFIEPLDECQQNPPDTSKVEAAYSNYINKLKLAESYRVDVAQAWREYDDKRTAALSRLSGDLQPNKK
jgi:hypothetical protein